MSYIEATGPIKFAKIANADSGDNTLVAAVTDKKIRVLSMFVDASGGANTIKFQSAAGGGATDLSGPLDLGSDGQITLPHNPCGWFETVAGELLNVTLSNATEVDGFLTYQEI